jgi:hypothetical protein
VDLVLVADDVVVLVIGNPYPSAKNAGSRRPNIPNGNNSRVPTMRARHSAGGGICWKTLRDCVDIMEVVAG